MEVCFRVTSTCLTILYVFRCLMWSERGVPIAPSPVKAVMGIRVAEEEEEQSGEGTRGDHTTGATLP